MTTATTQKAAAPAPAGFHKLSRAQLLTLAIALQDQRDSALALVREQQARFERVEALIEEPFASADKRHYEDDFNRGHCVGYNAAARE